MWIRCSRHGTAVACAALLLGAGCAHAAATWLPQSILASGINESAPAASVDAAGDVTAAFGDANYVAVTEHPAGGAWQTPVTVADVGAASTPAIATNGAGDTVLAYLDGGQIDSAYDLAGHPWSAPVAVSDLGGGATAPSVAIDGRGDAIALWMTSATPNAYTTIAWSYRPAGGTWQPALTLDDDAWSNVAPSVAFTSGGQATVVWSTANGPNDQALVSADLTAGPNPTWTSPAEIATAPVNEGTDIALDAAGDATVAWSYYTGSGNVNDVATSTRPAGGSWSAADVLGAGDGLGVSIATNPEGDAAIAWQPTELSIAVVTRPAGGAWSASYTPSGSDADEDPEVVVAPNGTTTVDFIDEVDPDDKPIDAAQLVPGGNWTTTTDLSSGAAYPGTTVVDPGGDIDIVREILAGNAEQVISVVEDAAGPALDGLSVPASGTVGVPVTMSVSPLDAWSAIATTNWNFGDGTSIPDQLVSHTYTAPGVYHVSVTSADTLGNPTTAGATITVGPAATPAIPVSGVRTATALTLTATQSHHRWREPARRRTLTPSLRRTPVDTRFALTVNQAARVTLTFGQVLPGRRVHGRCRSLTWRDRHDPGCTRTVTRGALTVHLTTAGRHTLRFTGRIGARQLAPGRFSVTIRATGAGGSATRRLRFTIA